MSMDDAQVLLAAKIALLMDGNWKSVNGKPIMRQEDFARSLGTSIVQLRKYIAGKVPKPHLATYDSLAKSFKREIHTSKPLTPDMLMDAECDILKFGRTLGQSETLINEAWCRALLASYSPANHFQYTSKKHAHKTIDDFQGLYHVYRILDPASHEPSLLRLHKWVRCVVRVGSTWQIATSMSVPSAIREGTTYRYVGSNTGTDLDHLDWRFVQLHDAAPGFRKRQDTLDLKLLRSHYGFRDDQRIGWMTTLGQSKRMIIGRPVLVRAVKVNEEVTIETGEHFLKQASILRWGPEVEKVVKVIRDYEERQATLT